MVRSSVHNTDPNNVFVPKHHVDTCLSLFFKARLVKNHNSVTWTANMSAVLESPGKDAYFLLKSPAVSSLLS